MTTDLATPSRASASTVARHLVPGAAGLVYAGVQLDGGLLAAAYRDVSTVPEDRLNFPFAGGLATTTSLTWGLSQALFLATLWAFARSGAVGTSRSGRVGAWLAVVGGSVFVMAHAVSVIFRDALTDDPAGLAALTLFAVGTVLTALGFLVAGAAVARAGRWTGWRRWTAAVVGTWMLLMIPLQFTALLPVAVAVYAATVAAFAVAVSAGTPSRCGAAADAP